MEKFKTLTAIQMTEANTEYAEKLQAGEADIAAMAAVCLHYWQEKPEQWPALVAAYRHGSEPGLERHQAWSWLKGNADVDKIRQCFAQARNTVWARKMAWAALRVVNPTIIPSRNKIRLFDLLSKVSLAKAIATNMKEPFKVVECRLKAARMQAVLRKAPKAADFPDFDKQTAEWISGILTWAQDAQDPVILTGHLRPPESYPNPMAIPKWVEARKKGTDPVLTAALEAKLAVKTASEFARQAEQQAEEAERAKDKATRQAAAMAAGERATMAEAAAELSRKVAELTRESRGKEIENAEKYAADASASAAQARAHATRAENSVKPTERVLNGVTYAAELASCVTKPSKLDSLWKIHPSKYAGIIDCLDKHEDMLNDLTTWATTVWRAVSAPKSVKEMDDMLRELEMAAGHARAEKHGASWEMEFLRNKLTGDTRVSDAMLAVYQCVVVNLMPIVLAVRLGCASGADQVAGNLPWDDILGRDWKQYVKTKFYMDQVQLNSRQIYVQYIEEGLHLVKHKECEKRPREMTPLERAIEKSLEESRMVARKLAMEIELQTMKQNKTQGADQKVKREDD
ncbi:hypothetical protein GGTG_11250 [Gaeumannomyces tritici R3-111a-1]|uniref:Uncharacterized protein n=1 Tax=Gaeumannomyces tritici (strain R3-111a-1) TaxID=644352 RepID=J3PCN0_GAET3|nr:hypothetical protein GGTG_11250 [Gaeumannomyces tritici R3-111a-1]EJT72000.1 hypothetical protein GGTG_11250 [Gaeumannomyces tritici R3-111a-1]